ncbi:heat-inducible transcriptional repressor HrcA [Holophaga foetida]|uniref:heat-inducible transcriptional repressor HrcA n=1 Tax=Holophaga foetida TaxID=35839 RepID=UPI00130EBA7A|nr:heat-inducible transcriptional repressor HrcA [Holophaga foetida]
MNPNTPTRSESLLRTLIEAYLVEGEPVGSRLLAKRFSESLSPATIRNVLADLEEDELVSQPHTSAGRVPTEKAYRYYVNRWVRPQPPGPDMTAKLSVALEGLDRDPEVWLRHASRIISEVMGGICIALPVRMAASQLVRLEFVPIDLRRIVAIWIGTSGNVEHQIVENTWGFDASSLTELGNFATAHFKGLTLNELRQKLLSDLQGQANEARGLWARLANLAEHLGEPAGEPSVVVTGLGSLGKTPEFGDPGRFRHLVEAFEGHRRLAQLLNAFAQSATHEVQLLLGSENPYFPSIPLATAMRTVSLPQNDRIALALVGPLRMDYTRMLGGLTWISEEIDQRIHRSL